MVRLDLRSELQVLRGDVWIQLHSDKCDCFSVQAWVCVCKTICVHAGGPAGVCVCVCFVTVIVIVSLELLAGAQ